MLELTSSVSRTDFLFLFAPQPLKELREKYKEKYNNNKKQAEKEA